MKSTDLMVLDRFSARAKWIIVFCCILLVVAGFLFYIGYRLQAEEREHIIQLHLKTVAGDGLLLLKPGDEGSPRYLSFARALYDARKNDTFLSGAYLMRIDNGTISYVVSDSYLIHGLDPTVAHTGDQVTEDRDIIRNATITGPVYSPHIYTSRWGSYISGYAPIKDSNGTVVGILGVDETAATVLSYDVYRFFNLVEVS
jgi:hypothetical protein